MENETVSTRVEELLAPFLSHEDLELVDVEYKKEGANWYLRIFVDKQGGVQLDDCSKVSNFISTELDRDNFVSQRYFLEVSSPGVERPLKKPADYVRFCGSKVVLCTTIKIEESKKFHGIIADYVDDQVVLETPEGLVKIPYHLIAKARISVF